jgi:proline iminopeptidase
MRVQIDDGRLFFDVDGAKLRPNGPWLEEVPTVVLLPPGPGADHSSFKDILGPRLAQVAQVVYVDPRGDGRSDRSSPSRWNLEAWSRDLHTLLDALEIERPILLGSSTGALVALHYAAHHPERPERLVLISAVARYVHARSIAVRPARRRGGRGGRGPLLRRPERGHGVIRDRPEALDDIARVITA